MAYIENILSNFNTKAMRAIVLLSLVGIIISAYPTYDKIMNYGPEKKLEIIHKLVTLNKELVGCQDPAIIKYRNEVMKELEKYTISYHTEFNNLLCLSSYRPYYTFLLKFLTGGAAFFFVYFIQACSVSIRSRRTILQRISLVDMAKINRHTVCIWIGLSVANMAFPFFNPIINYVFIPSCLTFVFAFIEIISKEASDKINTPHDDDFTGLVETT